MTPMSSVALLLALQFMVASPSFGPQIASVALRRNPVDKPTIELQPFQASRALSLGVELELQLVNTHDYDLAPYAEEMLRLIARHKLPGSVVPEMTSSMIEISTVVCHSQAEVLGQLAQIRDALVQCADTLNIAVVGPAASDWTRCMWIRPRASTSRCARRRGASGCWAWLLMPAAIGGRNARRHYDSQLGIGVCHRACSRKAPVQFNEESAFKYQACRFATSSQSNA